MWTSAEMGPTTFLRELCRHCILLFTESRKLLLTSNPFVRKVLISFAFYEDLNLISFWLRFRTFRRTWYWTFLKAPEFPRITFCHNNNSLPKRCKFLSQSSEHKSHLLEGCAASIADLKNGKDLFSNPLSCTTSCKRSTSHLFASNCSSLPFLFALWVLFWVFRYPYEIGLSSSNCSAQLLRTDLKWILTKIWILAVIS